MFSIFIANLHDLIRDKAALFFMVLFPSLMVFILGTMLSAFDNPDGTIDSITIDYLVEAKDPSAETTIETIVAQFEDTDTLKFVESSSLTASQNRVIAGEVSSIVVFTEPYGIQIYDGADSISNRAVHAIFAGVARYQGTATSISDYLSASPSNGLLEQAGERPELPDGMSDMPVGESTSIEDRFTASRDSLVEEKTFGVKRTMIDYYAITMTVMMFFMGSFFSGAMIFYQTRKDGTLKRILASSQPRFSIYLQFVASGIPQNIIQVGMIMLISALFFGAQYATSWQLNLLLFSMLFAAGLVCSALSLILGLFLRINPPLVLLPIAWIILFLSGTFSKEIFIDGVSQYMPPAIIHAAAFDLTLFGATDKAITLLVVCLTLTVLATIVGSLLFNSKKVVS